GQLNVRGGVRNGCAEWARRGHANATGSRGATTNAREELGLCVGDGVFCTMFLSDGIHDLSDECLAHARTVRTLLIALAERMSEITKDEAKVQDAVGAFRC